MMIKNAGLLEKIKTLPMPAQSVGEWQAYLEFIEAYFRNRDIEHPLVVEVGIGRGRQKKFYEELLGYAHIGIDFKPEKKPDIVGSNGDPATVDRLKEMLGDREVNLLFIDDGHKYQEVKRDYELFGPLAKNIIAIHDIVLEEWKDKVGRFWRELVAEDGGTEDKTFLTLTGCYPSPRHEYTGFRKNIKSQLGQGTGLILIQ